MNLPCGWSDLQAIAHRLVEIGRRFDARGWVLGTSGNFSVVTSRDPFRMAITPSSASKGDSTPDQILEIDADGMLKGLEGVRTHEHREWIPILENDRDMTRLADRVGAILREHPDAHGFLLRRHGLYTWGEDLTQAVRHVEILEFLRESVGRAPLPAPSA